MTNLVGRHDDWRTVADTFEVAGIVGCYQQPNCNPIARYLAVIVPHMGYFVTSDHVMFTTPGNYRVSYPLPQGARQFIALFEGGHLLYLIDWKHMVSHHPAPLGVPHAC